MTSFAAVAGLVLALAPAAQAVTIITDDVESLADYTISTAGWFDFVSADPFRGLSPVAGDFIMAGYSTVKNGAASGTFTLTAGFGAAEANLIQAGTYAFTISVGDTDWPDRASFEYFDHRLQATVGATELPNPVVTKPYVQPPIGDIKPGGTPGVRGDGIAEWTTTIITYTVPAGHALIGEQFTWAASFGHGAIPEDYAAAGFDAVSIEFNAIPEPSTFALAALGMLGLVGTRRRRSRA